MKHAAKLRMGDVASESLEWLWPLRIGLGKLTLLVGDPGLGKSFLTVDLAARVSRGAGWPDDRQSFAPQGSVILLNAEDNPSDTIRPRLEAAGADLTRIMTLCPSDGKGTGIKRQFSLAANMALLRDALAEIGDCRLLVVDPIAAYTGSADMNNNGDMRSLLFPLSELAAEHRVAVVAVSHLIKRHTRKAIHRALGSMAFVAAARSVWCVAEDPDHTRRRLLLPVKSNLTAEAKGLAFRLEMAPRDRTAHVAWDWEPVERSIDEVLEANLYRSIRFQKKLVRETGTVRWLREQLSSGPLSWGELALRATAVEFSQAQLNRAARHLNVIKIKTGFREGWTWKLPAVERRTVEHPRMAAQTHG